MGRIESEAKRMGAMVEDLLLLARIDEQRPLQQKPADLLLLANDAVVDTQASDRSRIITLTGLDGAAPAAGPGAGRRSQTAPGGQQPRRQCPALHAGGHPIELGVGVRTAPDGTRQSVIEVRDHGPGVPDEEAARIFERFYRADTSRTRETGGSGLGLAIVAAIVGSHSGTVRVGKTDGGGATLVVSLPFLDEEATEAVQQRTYPHRGRRRCPAGAPPAYARGVRKIRMRQPLPRQLIAGNVRDTHRSPRRSPCSAGPRPPPEPSRGLSMSIISVDTELLQLKSANVQATVERISADVHAMKRGLDELQASWRGSAATNFQTLVAEWTLTQGRVEASLASINLALNSAAATYAQAELGNAQRFSVSRPRPQASGVPWWKRSRHCAPSRTHRELRRADPSRVWLR